MGVVPLRAFVGHDKRETVAWWTCTSSLRMTCTAPILIESLEQPALRHSGLYSRQYADVDGQRIDCGDGRPFSTDFAFTRFLVPALCQWRGWALFCDSDFLWRGDVSMLFDEQDDARAVMVVQHEHKPREAVKMRGQAQQAYPRKNWSSLILWNCEHPSNAALTPNMVNLCSGRWLHSFGWLRDDEIGALPARWNWLEGHDDPSIDPAAVHYTRGTPDMPGYEGVAYADEWRAYGLG
jgi:hypothetical protein